MPQSTSPKIAFLGTGIMGSKMAARLLSAGYEATIWNRSPAKSEPLRSMGATIAATPSEACAEADLVIVMLSTGSVVDDVLFSPDDSVATPATNARKNAIFIVMSSIPVAVAKSQAEKLERIGKAYIDAPVSGGEVGAENGSLTIMAGGRNDSIEAARPILETMGRITRVGDVGAGQLAKLANQTIVGITISAVAEAFLIAEKGGVNLNSLLSALRGGFADSSVLRKHGVNIAQQQFEPGAYAHVQLKDLVTAEQQAASESLKLTVLPTVRKLYADMCENDRSELDHSGVYLEIRDQAIKTDAEK